ncbi:hypothetical protein [Arthrobacter sedimenti]|uniref:DUF2905 domain-containing protein n=1 Tax=Arthrobacter sedimenti TaxID=2694931 RepID=A0ABV8WSS9_9MICC
MTTLLALAVAAAGIAAIAVGIWLFGRLVPAIRVSGSPYNWPLPLQILMVTSVALTIGGAIILGGVFPAIG